ncbi:MAG: cell division protein FtsQ/DivIB [Eubacteriales bacterium]
MTDYRYRRGTRGGQNARSRPSYYWNPKTQGNQKHNFRRSAAVWKRRAFILLVIIALFAIGFLLVGFFSSYFDIKEISVSGDGKYSDEAIIEASGLTLGVKLYSADTESARKNILSEFPDLKDVKINKVLPATIQIEAIYEIPKYYICITGEYFTLSDGLRVLSRSASAAACKSSGLIYVSLPDVKRAVTGERLSFFYESDDYIVRFLTDFSESSFYTDADRIYIGGKFDISFVKTGYYRVKIGSFHDCALKTKMVEKVLDEGGYRGEKGVTIDVSDVSETAVSVSKTAKIE